MEPTERDETPETPEATEQDGDGEFVVLEHDDAQMAVEIPAAWTDTDTDDTWQLEDDIVGYLIEGSPNIDSFQTGPHEVPGVLFAASETLVGQLTPDDVLDEHNLSDCDYEGREEYSDEFYTGVQDTYSNCAGTETRWYMIAAGDREGTHIAFLQISVVTDEDEAAYERALATFIAGDLPPLE